MDIITTKQLQKLTGISRQAIYHRAIKLGIKATTLYGYTPAEANRIISYQKRRK